MGLKMTNQEIKDRAPDGATHYYEHEFYDSFYFYSNDVNMWFVWNARLKYWSSSIFQGRSSELKPL